MEKDTQLLDSGNICIYFYDQELEGHPSELRTLMESGLHVGNENLLLLEKLALSQSDVRELLPHLEQFVKTGRLI